VPSSPNAQRNAAYGPSATLSRPMLKLCAGFGRGSPAAFEVMTLLASRRRSALKLEQTLARKTRRTDSPAFRAKKAMAGVKGDLTIDEFERVSVKR
jgi:hypothetical protein